MKKIILIATIFLSLNSIAGYQNPSLEKFLNEFYKNPKEVMNQLPFKTGKNLEEFNLKDKISMRKKLLSNAMNKEEISGINSIPTLFHDFKNLLTNAFEIDEKPLKNVKLIEEPWSGYFWSMANGLIANRYADRKFTWKHKWQDKFEYIKDNPSSSYSPEKIEMLSPAEKYDLLIGSSNGLITSFMWDEGKREIEQFKKIRDWSGLCHGLAMASLQFPWPKYSIKVRSNDGKIIKFYPEDIKALGIFLWSGNNIPLRKLGGRCELASPRMDSNGRVNDPNCRDANPGAFHLALINRIGLQKKSLIMDSATDAEVWNFPIVSYNFTYYNPETFKKSYKIKTSMVPIKDFGKDKFSQFRSMLTEYIVGVEAKVDYLTHRKPKHDNKDPRTASSIISVLYRYDLEIDGKGKIIGGEWYSNRNPDFLWFPEESSDPKASFDFLISTPWDPAKDPLPEDWIESLNSSAEKGQVSSLVIKALFEYSNKGSN